MFTDFKDLKALTFFNSLLEEPWCLPGLISRISKLTLRAWQHLNLSEGDYLLFVALLGFVLFLFIYVMRSFVRSKISCNVRKNTRRNLSGKIWSRRKVFWQQMNITRSTYIKLALQRLPHDRETGDSHILVGWVSSASGQGTETVYHDVFDGSQGDGQCVF